MATSVVDSSSSTTSMFIVIRAFLHQCFPLLLMILVLATITASCIQWQQMRGLHEQFAAIDRSLELTLEFNEKFALLQNRQIDSHVQFVTYMLRQFEQECHAGDERPPKKR